MASPEQGLGDLAEAVITKLREGDGPGAHPVTVQIYADLHGRTLDETISRMQRVWVEGSPHWGFEDTATGHTAPAKALPAMKSARTTIRLSLGRVHAATVSRSDKYISVRMAVKAGNVTSLVFNALIDKGTRMVSPEDEMELVRILRELQQVRMVPVSRREASR